MFRIGEFSRLTQVTVRMLRYYDETGLLKPARTDKFTGYRLYAAEQIPDLNRIVFLRDLGFNVNEIRSALKNWSDEYISAKLNSKQAEIEEAIREEQDKLYKIELAKKDIQQEKIAVHYNVAIKSVPGSQVLSLRRIAPDYYAEGQMWKEMSVFANENHIHIYDNTFTVYHDTDYREEDVDIEVCAPVEKMGESADGFTYRVIEAVPMMACSMVYGPFENIAEAYLGFAGWLNEHNQYKMTGQSRQIVHRGPWNEECPDEYLTEIQIPLIKK